MMSNGMASRLEALCDGAQENHCPNTPACSRSGPEGDVPLPVEEWCGVCLLVHDVMNIVRGRVPTQAKNGGEK